MSEQNPEQTTTDTGDETVNPPQEPSEGAQEPTTDPAGPTPTDDPNGPENGQEAPAEPGEEGPTHAQMNETALEQGYHGVIGEPDADDPNAIQTADQAAPEDVDTDPASAVIGKVDTETGAGVPLTEQEGPSQDGESYQAGYFGTLPDGDDRPDLTLGGVTQRDYPDAQEGDTGKPVQD